MLNTPATSPGTTGNNITVGTTGWANTDYAKTSDLYYAKASLLNSLAFTSYYLTATNFGFSIPAGATINGILVEVEKKGKYNFGFCHVVDNSVVIIKADGTLGTTNNAAGGSWSTTEAYASYGGSTDLWGELWDDTKINDVDFGIALSVSEVDTYNDGISAWVNHIRITVYYTEIVVPAQAGFLLLMV